MGKYGREYLHQQAQPPWKIHPVWRGIGCVFMILIPILSFAGAVLLVRENARQGWVTLPRELAGWFSIPSLGQVYYADLAVAFILMFAGFGLVTVLYALLYRLVGPPRYGPMDAPPIKKKRRG